MYFVAMKHGWMFFYILSESVVSYILSESVVFYILSESVVFYILSESPPLI